MQEKRGEKEYGGKRTPGSGNQWVKKADVLTDKEMIEFKTTTKSSYSLSSSELTKLWHNALIDDKQPIFEIEFANDGVTCVVLDKNDYMAMREELIEVRESV